MFTLYTRHVYSVHSICLRAGIMSPVSISTVCGRCVLCVATALAAPMLGQRPGSTPNCDTVITTRDAARCIGAVRPNAPIPKLDPQHTYALPELIDITEMASPEGRIAWAMAKRALERTGIDRAL